MATFYENLGDGFDRSIKTVIQTSNTDILVGGSFSALDYNARKRLARLNIDGTEDATFNDNLGTGFTGPSGINYLGHVHSIAEHSATLSNKIVVAGTFITLNGVTRNYLVRLNSDGTEDGTFYSTISPVDNYVYKVQIDSNDNIFVVGTFTSIDNIASPMIAKLNSSGVVDSAFASNINNITSTMINSGATALLVDSNGSILIGGYFSNIDDDYPRALMKFNANGTEDSTFSQNIGDGVSGIINVIVEDSNGDYIIGGSFNSFNGNSVARGLFKLSSTGVLDTGFNSNVGNGFLLTYDGGANGNSVGHVEDIKVLTGNKLLIAGSFNRFNGNVKRGLVKLNADGTEDTASGFYTNLGSGFGSNNDYPNVYNIEIQSDNKILVGGLFNAFNDLVRKKLVRLNADGTEDDSNGTLPTITPSSIELNGRSLASTVVNEVNVIPVEDINYINSARVPDTIAPGVATNLSASDICAGTFTLSWTAPSDNDIAYYKIQRESGPNTWEGWTITIGPVVEKVINDVTPGSTNNWALITVDQEGNESSRSAAVTVKQGQEVLTCEMTTSGSGSASTACADSTTTTRYYYGTVLAPVAGDIIYTDSCGTTKLNGGGKYYKLVGFIDYSFQVSSTGVISNVATC